MQQKKPVTAHNKQPKVYNDLGLILILLAVFPPLAWYFMYRDKTYHRWFAVLLWMTAGSLLVFSALQLAVVVPKLMELYKSMGAYPPADPGIFFIFLIVLSVFEILLGYALFRSIRLQNAVSDRLVIAAIVMLTINLAGTGFIIAAGIISLLQPVYSLTAFS